MKYDYDILVIGLGPAGMAVSIMASEMGLKVCAVEKHRIGGECMNVGCIPSKALLRIAKTRNFHSKLKEMHLSEVPAPAPEDVFRVIQDDLKYISEKKTIGMFKKVDLLLEEGSATFIDTHTVQVGEKKISASRIFIAAGTKPDVPAYKGLSAIDYLTNENVFSQENIPESMIIVGAGAIACEMAQAFARLGSKVTIIYRGTRILRKESPEAAELLEKTFQEEGIEIEYEQTPTSFEKRGPYAAVETTAGKVFEAEKVLLALGRRMDLYNMGLDKAGVEFSEKGIKVNRYLETTTKSIYAVGDCNGYYQFSHAAMHQGMIALMNSMMPRLVRRDFRKFVVPLTIFTEPQISHVGMTEKELKKKKIKYSVVRADYGDYGAAIAEKVSKGFVKAFVSRFGRIYGAVVVGEGSGEMINEWGLAIQKKIRMHDIMFLQHSFPSMSFLNKRVSENWMMGLMQKSWLMRACCRLFFRLM